VGHGKVIEKTFLEGDRRVLGIVTFGGPFGTVPELLFEKKGLITALQQMLIGSNPTE
jgi:hypothetical protein